MLNKLRYSLTILFTVMSLFMIFGSTVYLNAQTTDATEQTQPTDPNAVTSEIEGEQAQPGFLDTLIKAYRGGGSWMHVLLILSIFVFAIFIERLYSLFIVYDTNGVALFERIQSLVVDNHINQAIKVCDITPRAVVATILKSGLKRAGKSKEEIQDAIAIASVDVISRVQKRTPFLTLFANVATLIGLLGTISGLISSFESVALADPAERQALLSAGISEAMNCTAFGLAIAIPCLLGYGFLMSKTSKILDEIDTTSMKLIDILTLSKKA